VVKTSANPIGDDHMRMLFGGHKLDTVNAIGRLNFAQYIAGLMEKFIGRDKYSPTFKADIIRDEYDNAIIAMTGVGKQSLAEWSQANKTKMDNITLEALESFGYSMLYNMFTGQTDGHAGNIRVDQNGKACCIDTDAICPYYNNVNQDREVVLGEIWQSVYESFINEGYTTLQAAGQADGMLRFFEARIFTELPSLTHAMHAVIKGMTDEKMIEEICEKAKEFGLNDLEVNARRECFKECGKMLTEAPIYSDTDYMNNWKNRNNKKTKKTFTVDTSLLYRLEKNKIGHFARADPTKTSFTILCPESKQKRVIPYGK
jgi:hypothetical protein